MTEKEATDLARTLTDFQLLQLMGGTPQDEMHCAQQASFLAPHAVKRGAVNAEDQVRRYHNPTDCSRFWIERQADAEGMGRSKTAILLRHFQQIAAEAPGTVRNR